MEIDYALLSWGTGHEVVILKLQQGEFRLHIRKRSFLRVAKHWNRLSVFKRMLDKYSVEMI